MKVLITGGNGFIGSHLADKLTKAGEDITLFDLNFGKNTEHLDSKKIIGDIRNLEDVSNAVKDNDAIFHLAAVSRVILGQNDPANCVKTNIIGAFNLLESLRKINKKGIVFFGSSREVYGEQQIFPVKEDSPKKPISVYGVTKLAAEELFSSYLKKFCIKSIIFRFSNVYGTERDLLDRVIPKFILRSLENKPISLYGGDQILDFTHLDDTLQGILKAYRKALEGDFIGEDFHFVTGKGTSVRELAETIINLCGSNSEIITEPKKNHDVAKFIGSCDKTNNLLNYKQEVELRDGIKKTIKCLQLNESKDNSI